MLETILCFMDIYGQIIKGAKKRGAEKKGIKVAIKYEW